MEAVFRLLAVATAMFALSLPAHAYLDPVSGSLLIQGLVALVAAILAGVKSIRLRCLALFSSLFGRKSK